ncbi:MAG TPA: putative metal-dependent hydrolase [Candidatus Acidoferrum sp.]|nr:putative metal-dependent hydrolase [Candidatus Acidoferrum sp.]
MDPRYPIGDFAMPPGITPEMRQAAIEDIASAPGKLRAAVAGLGDSQLETPYREGGWTVRQVVHHVADSHINAYIRLRLGLTETEPPIKAYQEADWARLEDAQHAPIEISLKLLEPLHERWVRLLRTVTPEQYARPVRHSESGLKTVEWLLFLYAWHGRHHTAHITELRKQKGWN